MNAFFFALNLEVISFFFFFCELVRQYIDEYIDDCWAVALKKKYLA